MDHMPPAATLPATIATDLPGISTASLDLKALPARLDDPTLALVEAMASAPLPALLPCDERTMHQCLRTWQATLPRRASDDVSAVILAKAYRAKLGHYPAAAIAWLCSEALSECEWFPTIAQCLAILGRWQRDDAALRNKRRAAVLAMRERQARLDETIAALEQGLLDSEAIAALPERWREIAETRGLVRRDADGGYRPRPLALPDMVQPAIGADPVAEALAAYPSQREAA